MIGSNPGYLLKSFLLYINSYPDARFSHWNLIKPRKGDIYFTYIVNVTTVIPVEYWTAINPLTAILSYPVIPVMEFQVQ